MVSPQSRVLPERLELQFQEPFECQRSRTLSLRKKIVILVKSRFYENFFCSFSKMKNRKVGADLFFRREMVNFKNA